MPLIETRGAGSAQGFGEFTASAPKVYIEDVFSTYLHTGNNSTQTITNGIDLAGKGGLVWVKARNQAYYHALNDTARGAGNVLQSQSTAASINQGSDGLTAFTSSGFSVGADNGYNTTNVTYASWTFRKQPKFFDVVTYTGNGSTNTISHALGSTPGAIFIKKTSSSGPWVVYHRSITSNYYLNLNTTAAETFGSTWISSVGSTSFTLDGGSADWNQSGQTFVAYLFAHDAGGFGLSGTDNVITCGVYSGSTPVNLGYEPQWILIKPSTDAGTDWYVFDNMRGWPVGSGVKYLNPNTSGAEGSGGTFRLTSTGFVDDWLGYNNTIYIAIRRGPMKVPTSGTSVFSPVARTGTGATASVTAGFAPDLAISAYRTAGEYMPVVDKLRGPTRWVTWQQGITNAESTSYSGEWFTAFTNTGVTVGADNSGGKSVNSSGGSLIQYYFQRAPGFFDVVCYTGTGPTSQAVTHNLGVQPTLIIVKCRSLAGQEWAVQINGDGTKLLKLNSTAAIATNNAYWNDTNPTSTTFTVGPNSGLTNSSGATYVAYLFATVTGVSKVGSYTGTAATLQIDCGFTGGARFVLIKRTDSTGDWYVWDSARGIVASTDPYLVLNSTAAEVTTTDWVDTYSAGFELSSAAGNNVNINTASYIFLSIA